MGEAQFRLGRPGVLKKENRRSKPSFVNVRMIYVIIFCIIVSIFSTTFYVDQATGNDGNGGQSESDALDTFSEGVSRLSSGDTLLVKSGTYYETSFGISTDGITIKRFSASDVVVIDGGESQFRTVGNSDWELHDGSIDLYKSVDTFPNFDQAYAYLYYGSGDQHTKLIPYETGGSMDAWIHITATSQIFSTTNGFYCGPGVYWRESDQKIYIRLTTTDIQADQGKLIPSNVDPRQNKIVVFQYDSLIWFGSGTANINIEGIMFKYRSTVLEYDAGANNIAVKDVEVLGGRYPINIRDDCHHLTFDNVNCLDTVPTWVTWNDVKNTDAGRPVHFFQCAYINIQNNVHDVTIKNSRVEHMFDVIDAMECVHNLYIHNNVFIGTRDDALQLGTCSYEVHFYENIQIGQANGPSRQGGTESHLGTDSSPFPGTKYFHHNIFDNRELDLMYREGDDQWTSANNGYTHRNVIGWHDVDDANTVDPYKIYHNTILVGEMHESNYYGAGMGIGYKQEVDTSYPQEVYNNIFILYGDHFFEKKTPIDTGGTILDGNLYYKVDGTGSVEFFSTMYHEGTSSDYDTLQDFKTDSTYDLTKSYYSPGWENNGIEGDDPQLDSEYYPAENGPADSIGVDLTSKGWPGITSGMNYRGAKAPRSTVTCDPVCTTNAFCDVGTCRCNPGWIDPPECTTLNTTCFPPCVNGNCVGDVCDCDLYWGGNDCSTRVCDPVCIQGICDQDSQNNCECTSGWSGPACDEAQCSAGCVNGNCVAPDTCQCDSGWGSAACDVPDCTTNGCVHGTCTQPDTCVCLPGWTGNDCNTHTCDPVCENGGTCTGPNTCTCLAGFGGPTCSLSNCNCIHGTCGSGGADDCTCNTGWESPATLCDTPICNPECANGGNCIAPNDCNCIDGWTGASCSIANCDPMCEHGVCTSPNSCTCMIGWSGDTCEIVECFSRPATHNQICSGHGDCIGPNTCECDSEWHGVMCNHEVVPGAICYGIESSDPTVCSARGSCAATDTCECDKGYEGEVCEVLISCKGLLWDDLVNNVCSGNGVCISKNKCRCYTGWKADKEGDCTARDLASILLLSTLVPAGGVLLILGIACCIALCVLIFIKRNKVVEYVEIVRNTVRETLKLGGKNYKEFQDNLPREEELDDGFDHGPRKRPRRKDDNCTQTNPKKTIASNHAIREKSGLFDVQRCLAFLVILPIIFNFLNIRKKNTTKS